MNALNYPVGHDGNSANSVTDQTQIIAKLNPTAAMPQGELVCLATPDGANAPVDGSHSYAFLVTDSSTNQFLLYNPWGIYAPTTLAADITTTDAIDNIQVEDASSIGVGDVLAIENECMQVTQPPVKDTTDIYYTLTVSRGLYGTTPSLHNNGDSVHLNLGHAGTPIKNGRAAGVNDSKRTARVPLPATANQSRRPIPACSPCRATSCGSQLCQQREQLPQHRLHNRSRFRRRRRRQIAAALATHPAGRRGGTALLAPLPQALPAGTPRAAC